MTKTKATKTTFTLDDRMYARMYAQSKAAEFVESLYQCKLISREGYRDVKNLLVEFILVVYVAGRLAQLKEVVEDMDE
jgi:hypothetical protein